MNKKSIAILLVLIGLPIGWYSYNKSIKAASLRSYAVEQCEIKGGYHTKGPVSVPGYLFAKGISYGSEMPIVIKKLVIENYNFVEVPGRAIGRQMQEILGRKFKNNDELKGLYYRLTLESNDSPLCEQFNAYRGTGRLHHAEAGLNLNQCIGIETLTDKSQLKSEYEHTNVLEHDDNSRIVWRANYVKHMLTGEEFSRYRNFSSCVTGWASSGEGRDCNYGNHNIITCPANRPPEGPDLYQRFIENSFVSTSSKPVRPMQTINVSLPKDKSVTQGVARLLDVSDQAPVRPPRNESGRTNVTISQNGRAYIVADGSKTRAHELFIIDTEQRLIREVDIAGFTRGFVRFSDPVHIDGNLVFIAIQNVYQADPGVVLFEVSLAGELISSASFDLPVSNIIQPGNHTWERVEAIKQVEGGYEMVVPHLPPGESPRQYVSFFLATDYDKETR